MIKSIQALRGIFALLIFLSHCPYGNTGPIFARGGDIGVAFFFILSGFALTYGYDGRARKINPGRLLAKRLSKFYPLHIFCLLCAIYICRTLYLGYILPDLFLLQSWIPDTRYVYSLNGVSWFLSDLIFMYVCFLLLRPILYRHAKPLLMIFGTVIAIYSIFALPKLSVVLSGNQLTYWVYVFPPVRALDFVLGMLLYYCVTKHTGGFINTHRNLVEAGSVLILTLFIITSPYIDEAYNLALWWWIPQSAVILVFFTKTETPGLISRILSHKVFVWFGNQSLSFYLLHVLCLKALAMAIHKCGIEVSPMLFVIAAMAITTGAAAICEKYIVKSHIFSVILRHKG